MDHHTSSAPPSSAAQSWDMLALGSGRVALLLFVIAITLRALYYLLVYPYFTSPLRHIPGPKDNSIIFGQGLKILCTSWVPHLYHEWASRWPDSPFVRFLGLGGSETLVATGINAYREILQSQNSSFVKPALTKKSVKEVFGEGLPFAEGHLHKRRKAALTQAFSVPQIRAFAPTIQRKASQLVDLLDVKRDAIGEVEIETDIWKSVIDLISVKALGVDLNHLGSSTSPLQDLFQKTVHQSKIGHIIQYLCSYVPLRRLLPLKVNKEFVQSSREIRQFLKGYIDAARETKAANEKQDGNRDALHVMMEQENLWDDEESIEYLVNLFILGHDTTACSLVWAVHALAQHPDHQQRLREEILSLRNGSDKPTYGDLERYRYLDKFLHEVLRVFCPLIYIPREAIRDVVIDGVSLPKGTIVHLSPAVMNLHPKIWGDDSRNFDPDRWDRLQGDATSAYAFATFHNGPRVCIGKHMSMVEMKMILIELVSRFRIEAIGRGDLEFASPSFTLRPKEKLRVKLVDY